MVLLHYPRIPSKVPMKPGNQSVVSEWFTLPEVPSDCHYGVHRPTRAQPHESGTFPGSMAPRRSRIRDFCTFSVHPTHVDMRATTRKNQRSNPHRVFRKTLPNLQHLDFRAAHVSHSLYVTPTPGSLFAKNLPRLKSSSTSGRSVA